MEQYATKDEMKKDIKNFLSSSAVTKTKTYSKEQDQQRKLIAKEFAIPQDMLFWSIVGLEKEFFSF